MSNTERSRVTIFLAICFNIHNTEGILDLNRAIIVALDTYKGTIYPINLFFGNILHTLLYPFLVHPSPVTILGRRRKIASDLTIIAPNVPYVPRPIVLYPGPP